MKKSKIYIVVIIVVILGILLVGYSKFFPLAREIEYPEIEQIGSISINDKAYADATDINTISEHILDAKPTRKQSSNDKPISPDFSKINIHMLDGNVTSYYVYETTSKVYIEIPYYGIYVINEDILNFI